MNNAPLARTALFCALALPAVVVAACKENEEATKVCRPQADGEKCQKCCDENGAEGFAFVSGHGCVCRGVKPPPSASASAQAPAATSAAPTE